MAPVWSVSARWRKGGDTTSDDPTPSKMLPASDKERDTVRAAASAGRACVGGRRQCCRRREEGRRGDEDSGETAQQSRHGERLRRDRCFHRCLQTLLDHYGAIFRTSRCYVHVPHQHSRSQWSVKAASTTSLLPPPPPPTHTTTSTHPHTVTPPMPTYQRERHKHC